MSYHDHLDIDERERVRAAERAGRPAAVAPRRATEEEALGRVASCVWITAGSLGHSRAEDVAKELLRRGWIAVDKIDPDFRESGSVRL